MNHKYLNNIITFDHECIDVSMNKPNSDDLVQENTLILITKNLNRLKPKKTLKAKIRAWMAKTKVFNKYFKTMPKVNSMGCVMSKA
jgi:hypothetical protein